MSDELAVPYCNGIVLKRNELDHELVNIFVFLKITLS